MKDKFEKTISTVESNYGFVFTIVLLSEGPFQLCFLTFSEK